MTQRLYVWLACSQLPLALALGGCSDDKQGPARPATDSGVPGETVVMGRVLDTDGSGLAEVTVEGGGAETVSEADGSFELDAEAGSDVVVTFSRPGYVRGVRRVDVLDATPTALQVTLAAESPAIALDSDAGGTVTGSRGATLNAPPGAFVDASGAAVTGEVQVHLTPLDPAVDAELAAYPGELQARTLDGSLTQLETFGVLDVTVRQQEEDLQIADDQSIEIQIPAPSSGVDSPPETVGLWSFDAAAAEWVEEGTATYNAADHTYGGTISHLSPWNADEPVDITCIRGTVVDQNSDPVAGALIQAQGIDYLGIASATADAAGEFCVVVRQNSELRVTAIHPEGGGSTRDVTSGGADSSIPPVCADCKDVGTWIVEQGSVTGPEGEQTDCSALRDPYTGTCAEGWLDIFECFNPQGSCTYDATTGEVVYGNGARMTTSGTEGELYGESGELCGTTAVVMEGDNMGCSTYTDASGQTWLIGVNAEGDQIIECPDGEVIVLTTEEATALQACAGTDSQPTEECEVIGLDVGLTPCSSDDDCAAGEVCCAAVGYCLAPEICDML
jgi:hypothetical protein